MAVLAPTRELAIQIGEVLHKVGEVVKVETAIVYGGMPKYVQKNALKTAHIVVATPGRLQDLMQEGSCDLSKVPSSPPLPSALTHTHKRLPEGSPHIC
jgi:ATP-dependent RNA helicase DBP3